MRDDFPLPESVQTRAALADFVQQLHSDLLARPDDWENPTLASFLEAMAAYLQDVPGYLRNVDLPIDAERPSWQLFALVLAGARCYE